MKLGAHLVAWEQFMPATCCQRSRTGWALLQSMARDWGKGEGHLNPRRFLALDPGQFHRLRSYRADHVQQDRSWLISSDATRTGRWDLQPSGGVDRAAACHANHLAKRLSITWMLWKALAVPPLSLLQATAAASANGEPSPNQRGVCLVQDRLPSQVC